jgi:hydroxyacylglutathione hydrolase
VILRQFMQTEPIALSYLIGCAGKAAGAAVDYVEILPGAFSGSVCGRRLSGKPMSTIGFERRSNSAFAIADEAAFVDQMLQDIPPPPPGADAERAANAGLVLA